jgi:hypothetical protein
VAESPSALLERAAARLEELAAAVEGGPWCQHDFAGEPILLSKPSATDKTTWRTVIGEGVHPAVIAWVEAMQPDAAALLAAMLRSDAKRISWAKTCAEVDKGYKGLELARRVLGEHTEETS